MPLHRRCFELESSSRGARNRIKYLKYAFTEVAIKELAKITYYVLTRQQAMQARYCD
jgi:hypothetical protein